ncbi:Superoxide dismutase [Hortaea werneckii]|nr:Superoxide dismutase [Hortaea werneckii]
MQLANFTIPLGLSWMFSSAQTRLESIQETFFTSNNGTTASSADTMAYQLPSLPYSYDALEPHFDAETMEIHHSRHHQTYVNSLNAALEGNELRTLAVDELITKLDQVAPDKQTAVRNHGGGHSNHSFFWRNLKVGTTIPAELKAAIERDFGSLEAFRREFERRATTVFGSGWAWLVVKKPTNGGPSLKIVTTKDQDSPLMGEAVVGAASGFPILGLDVWEHAYYLKYRNKRPDYIKAFWEVVNWEEAGRRFGQVS